MNHHVLTGLTPKTLAGYLAGLGLFRVLSTQVDRSAKMSWQDDVCAIYTTVNDIPTWFINHYKPTPLFSPWNGGSGFGAKDKTPKETLGKLLTTDSERFSEFKLVYAFIIETLNKSERHKWPKEVLVRALRNGLTGGARQWLDAVVVLASSPLNETLKFPALGGTGGNDGRLELSSNFHQRLFDVIPELGADRMKSASWFEALLYGTMSAPLVKAAIGQFDAVSSGLPGSSGAGSSVSLVNPWQLILLLEGICLFAATTTKRQGEHGSFVSAPFTVQGNPGGPNGGAWVEQSRGEVWVPLFDAPSSLTAVKSLFSGARASWNRRSATKAAHMYASIHSLGVSRGVDRFGRFGLLQRNGLAFSSVLLDQVEVKPIPAVNIATEIEPYKDSIARGSGKAIQHFSRRADTSMLEFARHPDALALVDWLHDLALIRLAASRSSSALEKVRTGTALPRASAAPGLLAASLKNSPEWRVAAALASSQFHYMLRQGKPSWVPMSVLLLGGPRSRGRSWEQPVAVCPDVRPISDSMGDVLRWWSHQSPVPADKLHAGISLPSFQRQTCSLYDAYAFAEGLLDEREIHRATLAFCMLDWDTRIIWDSQPCTVTAFNANVELLKYFARGRVAADIVTTSTPAASVRRGLHATWIRQLLLGSTPANRVLAEASSWTERRDIYVNVKPMGTWRWDAQRRPLSPVTINNDLDARRLAASLLLTSSLSRSPSTKQQPLEQQEMELTQ